MHLRFNRPLGDSSPGSVLTSFAVRQCHYLFAENLPSKCVYKNIIFISRLTYQSYRLV